MKKVLSLSLLTACAIAFSINNAEALQTIEAPGAGVKYVKTVCVDSNGNIGTVCQYPDPMGPCNKKQNCQSL